MRGVEAVRVVVLAALGAACRTSPPATIPPPTTPPPATPCAGATAILLNGADSGYVRCADGAIDRVVAAAADPTIAAERCAGTEEDLSACKTDADCGVGPTHACVTYAANDTAGPTESGCRCETSCASDADCGPNEACMPGKLFGGGPAHAACVSASCKSSGDCASGECGAWDYDDGCWTQYGLACRDPADACRADADCSDTCAAPTGGGWGCLERDCAVGRPLVIEGTPRTAPSAARSDWSDVVGVTVPDDADLRAALAARWSEIAALEHASVASFARVTLQLLALGAPADLIADTQAAGQDEVAHARFAYALAGAFGGAARGPGPLSLAAFTLDVTPEAVLADLIDEACVSETFGAAELAVAAELAQDPVLADGLRRLAADEARHAALAWRDAAEGCTLSVTVEHGG